jgi:arylsulfatase A-like enzyme
MSDPLERRDFLKLLSIIPPSGLALRAAGGDAGQGATEARPHIIIVVFDALSALNVPLYGYPRQTTPNFERFAQRATVYHRHYSAGSFTTPGTASLLTGTTPWRHRGLHIYGNVLPPFETRNLFTAFENSGYDRIAYTHNDLANLLLHQFSSGLDELKKVSDLCLFYEKELSENLFSSDHNAAFLAERSMVRGGAGSENPASLFYALLHEVWRTKNKNQYLTHYTREFPRGVPAETGSRLMFLLEDAIDWAESVLASASRPVLGYFHFYPPHRPYNTRREFVDRFRDGWSPPEKPEHYFSKGVSQGELNKRRRLYDEYVAYADAEFGRLLDFIQDRGMLESSCLVLTSDHGEMFERGILAHITETMYEPILRVPLIVSWPGQKERRDVYRPTSSIDMLPTLTELAGLDRPDWSEGESLMASEEEGASGLRSIYCVDGKENPIRAPLTKGTVALISGEYKLIRYLGFGESLDSEYELYDVVGDPEELTNLFGQKPAVAARMKAELGSRLAEENRAFT